MRNRNSSLAGAVTGLVLVLGAGVARAEPKDIVDTAVGAGSFKTLAGLLKDAGLIDVLKGDGPFTVFAPTDEAFAKIPAETLAKLAADKEALKSVLLYHVVPGKVLAADVKAGEVETALKGKKVTLVTEGGVTVNGAKVVKADVLAKNGVIHVIDTVILPAK